MGFEPTRGDPNGLAVHRLNHSATSSTYSSIQLMPYVKDQFIQQRNCTLSLCACDIYDFVVTV